MINMVPRFKESKGLKGSKWSKGSFSLVNLILLAPDEGGCRRCIHIPFVVEKEKLDHSLHCSQHY